MVLTELKAHLKEIGACSEGVRRALNYTPQQAWDACKSPEWLFWWAGKTCVNNREDVMGALGGFVTLAKTWLPDAGTWGKELAWVGMWPVAVVPPEEFITTHDLAMLSSRVVTETVKHVGRYLGDDKRVEFTTAACATIRPLLKLPFGDRSEEKKHHHRKKRHGGHK